MEKGKPLPISALPKGERPERARPESEERESQSPKAGSPKKTTSGRASSKTGKSGASAPETKSPKTRVTKTRAAKTRAAKTTATKTGVTKADSAKVNPAKANPAKPSLAKPSPAKPSPTKSVAPVSTPGEARARPGADALLKLILARLDDMKAEETVTIDLRGKSTLADYMVVSSGRANRHVGAIAEHVIEDLRKVGIKGTHAEGMANCDWVLIDAGDVIVHLFRPEVRAFYNLEKMWTAGRDARVAT